MDKFVTRKPRAGADTTNKRPAPSAPAPSQKKAKAAGAAWTKAKLVPVAEASYQDQTLEFATLRDGRELLLGAEVWALPPGASAASPAALKSLARVGKLGGDRFAALPGVDAAAVVFGSGFGKEAPRLAICELPSGEELVADVPLPGVAADRSYRGGGFVRRVHAAPRGDGAALLVVTNDRLWSFSVRRGAGGVECALDASVDLAAGPLAKRLGKGELQATALYVGPSDRRFALAGKDGVVHVVPLEAGATAPARSVRMHEPLKKSDKDARVCDLAVWRDGPRGAKMVTVGSDGKLAVCALDDGARLATHAHADDAWHATSSGSGPSKQYRHAAAHNVVVDGDAGVAFTASQFEPVGHLFDLRSKKSSAKGKELCATPKLAGGAPSKVSIMCAAASAATGLFAYSNSNNGDDATLKFVVPAAAKK